LRRGPPGALEKHTVESDLPAHVLAVPPHEIDGCIFGKAAVGWSQRGPDIAIGRLVLRHLGREAAGGYPQGAGRVQQLRRRTLRRTPARCHRGAAYARGDGLTYIHEGRQPAVRLQQ
jgi:hypothetical protein